MQQTTMVTLWTCIMYSICKRLCLGTFRNSLKIVILCVNCLNLFEKDSSRQWKRHILQFATTVFKSKVFFDYVKYWELCNGYSTRRAKRRVLFFKTNLSENFMCSTGTWGYVRINIARTTLDCILHMYVNTIIKTLMVKSTYLSISTKQSI